MRKSEALLPWTLAVSVLVHVGLGTAATLREASELSDVRRDVWSGSAEVALVLPNSPEGGLGNDTSAEAAHPAEQEPAYPAAMPSGAVPSAPVPSAPVPSAPVPSAPVPSGAVPTPSASEASKPRADQPPRRHQPEPSEPWPGRAKPSPAKTHASASEAASTSAVGGEGLSAAPSRGSAQGGGEDLPPGVRSLGASVTRALPRAAELDPVWFDLATGSLGEVVVYFETGPTGTLVNHQILDEPPPSPILIPTIQRAFAFLGRGLFALDQSKVTEGVQRMKISAQILDVRGNDNVLAEPHHTFVMHQQAPTRAKPGKAYVTFNSGRRVAFVIELLSANE